jgi:class 3 adenylate cyclase
MLKLVTVLFADVVASTARAERMHPEDARALMSDYFAAMAEEIEAEGGTIEKFIGDAIMAVFGAPTAHEDDPLRGVRAARRMLERLRSWNEKRDPAEQLELRIGLNTGEAIASGAREADLLVTGDAVNVAARLEQAADPGAILIGERTARAVRSYFELRRLEPLALKGKAESVAAWLVEAEREAPEPRGLPGLSAPLVGREYELELLQTTFERVRVGGRPHLVTLVGDAGVGKSRLVREFLSALDPGARVLVGRCLPYGQGITLWPLAEILKSEALIFDTDPSKVALAKLEQLVEREVVDEPAPALTVAALASTLGLRPPDDPLGALDPREAYRELVAAWRVLLGSIARRAPVVVVVEDIHWADATMLDVLDELAERVEGPIFFLCPARPDLLRTRPEWGGGRRSFSSLPLDPLTSEESARLVSSLLEVDQLPESVRDRILERSEGNPFFLEEIVRHLIDDGLLVRTDGRWRAVAGIDDVEIPDNVQTVILARLDLLAPEEKRVAQRAAVVGRVFWDGAVARLAGVGDLDAVLQTLRRRELVLDRGSSAFAGQNEYIFKHVLIRDVAYASLPRKERGRAHAELATWIEETSGERSAELAELLAHHCDAAFSFVGDEALRRRARGHFLAAAESALRRFAIPQSERFAQRSVELSADTPERVEALEALGDLHNRTFNGDGAWRAYGDALTALSDGDAAFARLAGKAALFGARWVGSVLELPPVEEVRRIIDRGLDAAGPDEGAERTLLLVERGFLLLLRDGRHDEVAEAAVREAEAAAERLGHPDLLSAALDLVLTWEFARGRHGAAYRATLRRQELVPHMTDVKEIGDSLAMCASTAQRLGRYAEAEAAATACVERSRGIDAGSYLHGLTWRVAARFMLGEWEGALADQAELERLAALDRRDLPAGYTMRAYTYAALCHELRGERDEADRYVDVLRKYFAVPGQLGPVTAAPAAARALLHRRLFDEAAELCQFEPRTVGAGLTLEVLCELVAERGSWEEAAHIVAAARDEAVVGEQLSLPLFADRLEGRAAAAASEDALAAELLRRSADGFAQLGAQWEEAWSRLLLAETLADGRRREAEGELRAALPVFKRLGSIREATRAAALLADSGVTR